MTDLSKLSTQDLQHMAAGRMDQVSESGLRMIAGEPAPQRQRSMGDYAGDLAVGALRGAANVGTGVLSLPKLVGLPPIGGQEFIDDTTRRWNDLYAGKTQLDSSAGQGPRSAVAPVANFVTEVAGTAGVPGSRILQGAKFLPKAVQTSRAGAAALEGAASGAVLGQGEWDEVGIGAGSGVVGQKLVQGAGRMLFNPAKQTPQAEQLRRMGVQVTAGQGSQGHTFVKAVEEASQYLPGPANAVRRMREEPYHQLRNIVAGDIQPPTNPLQPQSGRMMPVGQSMDEVIANARREMSAQYDNVLQGKTFVEDAQLAQELADASLTPRWVLSESQRGALARFINDQLNPGRTVGGWPGEHLSKIRQAFDAKAASMTNPEMAGALREVSDNILLAMARQSPEVGQVYKALEIPYRNLKTAELAAKNATAQGDFGVAALAQAGEQTHNNQFRDLGRLAATAMKDDINRGGQGLRTALGIAALGGAGYLGGTPGATGAVAVPTALYLGFGTRAGQKYLSGQYKWQKKMADLLRQHPDAGSATGAALGVNLLGD